MRSLALAVAALLALAACTPSPAVLHPVRSYQSPACDGSCAEAAEITYLGVGGFLIRFRDRAVLTAPFFTTPPLKEVALWRTIRPDTARIDERMQALLPGEERELVRAVLVGHSHYDHLMDVPYIARRYFADSVRVYGNQTMAHMLASDPIAPRLVALDTLAGDAGTPGRWIYPRADSTVRFMALRSQHARHVPLIKFFRRQQTTSRAPEDSLPPTAWTWAEGETHAFVVDFLDDDRRTVLFRVHYQDAASNPEWGFPPRLEEHETRFDVAIVCAGNFDLVDSYPQGILRRLTPRHVVVGHWEDFFQPQSDTPEPIPALRAVELVKRVDSVLTIDAERTTPRPGAQMRFCACRRGGGSPL